MTIRQLGATIREPGYIASEFRVSRDGVCSVICVTVCVMDDLFE